MLETKGIRYGGLPIACLLAAIGAPPASSQMSTSTCMDMGSGMTHCDTMQLNPAPSAGGDGGAVLGQAIGNLIAGNRERSFRKRVGRMLADGNCQGAARYALEQGRLELGNEIARSCRPAAGAVQSVERGVGTESLADALQRVAANARTPMVLDNITSVARIEAVGEQLLLTAQVNAEHVTLSDDDRARIVNQLCAYEGSSPLLAAGASIRIVYFDRTGQQIGAAMATRSSCGL